MNRLDKETLSRIIRRMQKQNDYEKFAELTAASAKVAFRVDFHSVEFSPDDPYHPYPILIKNIHSVASDEDYL